FHRQTACLESDRNSTVPHPVVRRLNVKHYPWTPFPISCRYKCPKGNSGGGPFLRWFFLWLAVPRHRRASNLNRREWFHCRSRGQFPKQFSSPCFTATSKRPCIRHNPQRHNHNCAAA